MNLGEYVSKRRKALGLSQNALANSLSYSDQAISKFEAGDSLLSLSVIPALANILQLSLDDLLLRNETPAPFKDKNPPFANSTIMANLFALRVSQHLSQKQEAEIFGVSRRTIINYEDGTSLPSLDVLDKILAYFSLAPHAFFYESLFPEVQNSRSKHHQFPKALAFLLLGFVLGGGVLSAALTPALLKKSSSGDYQLSYSSTSATSQASTSSGPFAYLEKLVVITTSGTPHHADLPSGGSLGLTIYGGPYFVLNSAAQVHYQVDYWLKDAPTGVSLEKSSTYPCALLKAESGTPYSLISPFFVFAKITYLDVADGPSVTSEDPLEVVVSAPQA